MAPAEVTGRKPEVTGYKSGSRAKAKKKEKAPPPTDGRAASDARGRCEDADARGILRP